MRRSIMSMSSVMKGSTPRSPAPMELKWADNISLEEGDGLALDKEAPFSGGEPDPWVIAWASVAVCLAICTSVFLLTTTDGTFGVITEIVFAVLGVETVIVALGAAEI